MSDLMGMMVEFHEKFGLSYSGPPRVLQEEVASFRQQFLFEEAQEYADASATGDKEGMIDALVDLVYVAIGTAYLHGFDFNEAFRRVHAANMAKVRALCAEDSKRGSTFDVVKPAGWLPPSHSDLVAVCPTCCHHNHDSCPYLKPSGPELESCDEWEKK